MLQLLIASVFLFPQSPAKTPPQGGCAVSHSLAELKRTFAQGRVPRAGQATGTWVSIGSFIQNSGPTGTESIDVDCAGLRHEIVRGTTNTHAKVQVFEDVLLIDGYSVQVRIVANEQNQKQVWDRKGGLRFAVGFGGDASPSYSCHLTKRGTLACVVDPYYWGFEFKKMAVPADQLCQVKELLFGNSDCVVPEEERANGR